MRGKREGKREEREKGKGQRDRKREREMCSRENTGLKRQESDPISVAFLTTGPQNNSCSTSMEILRNPKLYKIQENA